MIAALLAAAPATAFVGSDVVSGVLTARSNGAADIVKVSCGPDLRAKINGLDPTGAAAACSDVGRIRVFGFGGPDTINLTRVSPKKGFTNLALRQPYSVRAYGGQGSDRLTGGAFPDLLSGGPGNDKLRGRQGSDTLKGGPGSDLLIGGPGDDRLSGGPGDDLILARDGHRDQIRCGAGLDVVHADRLDRVSRSCETVLTGPAIGGPQR